ncbi:hypothetical protein BC835DRAFT_154935 [Cytidiella melzeri]|nr:hypothetical protein BC835DRAFT_154935 [Cytidiella melzeri]
MRTIEFNVVKTNAAELCIVAKDSTTHTGMLVYSYVPELQRGFDIGASGRRSTMLSLQRSQIPHSPSPLGASRLRWRFDTQTEMRVWRED